MNPLPLAYDIPFSLLIQCEGTGIRASEKWGALRSQKDNKTRKRRAANKRAAQARRRNR